MLLLKARIWLTLLIFNFSPVPVYYIHLYLSAPGWMKHFIMYRCPFFYSLLKMDTSMTTGKTPRPAEAILLTILLIYLIFKMSPFSLITHYYVVRFVQTTNMKSVKCIMITGLHSPTFQTWNFANLWLKQSVFHFSSIHPLQKSKKITNYL